MRGHVFFGEYMNTLSAITGGVITQYGDILTALLLVMGFLVSLVYAVWGVLQVVAMLTGKSSADVSQKMGRIFGELVHEDQYAQYASARRKADVNQRFKDRYDAEHSEPDHMEPFNFR